MSRVKGGVTTRRRHKKVLKAAKGFRGRRKNCFRTAVQAVEKSRQYQYRDRKNLKRNIRSLWIQRINAAARSLGLTYGRLIDGLAKANVVVDRKMLAELAVSNFDAFTAIVQQAKTALGDAFTPHQGLVQA